MISNVLHGLTIETPLSIQYPTKNLRTRVLTDGHTKSSSCNTFYDYAIVFLGFVICHVLHAKVKRVDVVFDPYIWHSFK